MGPKADARSDAKVRVGAVLSADATVVRFLGWGILEGEEVPDENAGGLGALMREMRLPNPKIRLDNGKVVWGCECWWGSEERVQRILDGRTVEVVDIDAVRAVEEKPCAAPSAPAS